MPGKGWAAAVRGQHPVSKLPRPPALSPFKVLPPTSGTLTSVSDAHLILA